MTLHSLRNRVRRLEASAGMTPPKVVGVVLRSGVSLPQARRRITAAGATAPVVYVANLTRLPL